MVYINKKRPFSKVSGEGSGLSGKVDPKNVSDVNPKKEITTAEAAWLLADEEGRAKIRLLKPVFAETMEQRHPETAIKKKGECQNGGGLQSNPPDYLDTIPTLHDIVHDPTHKEGDMLQSTSSEPEKGDEEIPVASGNGGDGNNDNNGNGGPPPDPEPEDPNSQPQPKEKESKMDKTPNVYNKPMIIFSIVLAAVCLLIGGVGATVLAKNNAEKEAAQVSSTPGKIAGTSSGAVLTAGKSFQTGHPLGEEGVVYMDSEGNTYERHTAGWRECKFYANGVFIKRYFVGDTSKPHNVDETYNQCKLLGRVLMAEMKATTPYKMETAVTK